MKRCGENPAQPEFSLCGDAFDLSPTDTGDDEFVPFRFANPGEWITCERCREVVKLIKNNFTYQGKVKRL